jgi:selenocysteine lyase/cysteine desulfurase
MARAAGALTFVDAVHYAPHRLVDVAELGCDFLACSAYKFFGPHAGILWGRARAAGAASPPTRCPPRPTAPDRWETGTQNHEAIAGIAGRGGLDRLHRRRGRGEPPRGAGAARSRRCTSTSRRSSAAWRTGCAPSPACASTARARGEPRTPTAAFTVEGDARRGGAAAGREGVFVWNGDFYATTVCDALGLSDCGGLIRAGIAPYTTEDDVRRLVDGVARIARG